MSPTIKFSDKEYDEVIALKKLGNKLKEIGNDIENRCDRILSTYATYGLEVPVKRNKRITEEYRVSRQNVDFN